MALSVPRPQQSGTSGTPFHDKNITESTPGVAQELFAFTVPAGVVRNLSLAAVIVRQEGRFTVEVDGDIVGSGRTGPGQQGIFWWYPFRPVAPGGEVKLRFTQRPNSPAVTIEGYLMASDTPA